MTAKAYNITLLFSIKSEGGGSYIEVGEKKKE